MIKGFVVVNAILCAQVSAFIPTLLRSQRSHLYMSTVEESSSVVGSVDQSSVAESALSMNIAELGSYLGGSGRANIAWDFYRLGIDPQLYFSDESRGNQFFLFSFFL